MPLYSTLYALLQQYIYGVDAVLSPDMTLTLTVLATAGSLFVVSLPFVLVWRIIRGLAK